MCALFLLLLASTVITTILCGNLSQFPSAVRVWSGDPVRMTCQLDGVKAYCYTVAWMRVDPDSGTMAISNVAARPSSDTECLAVIQNPTAADSGMYYCTVTDKQKVYVGSGTSVSVQASSSTAPSVDLIWFPSSSSYDHAVPVQCVVKGVVPSQVKVFWMTGGRRERGQAVCLRAGGEVFTVSQRLWSEECERGEECTCVVEHEGQIITSTLEPKDVLESCYAAVSLYRSAALIASLLVFMTAAALASCSARKDNIK